MCGYFDVALIQISAKHQRIPLHSSIIISFNSKRESSSEKSDFDKETHFLQKYMLEGEKIVLNS